MVELLTTKETASILAEHHYLGAARRGFSLRYKGNVVVLSNPSSRRLPHETWLELTRWLLMTGGDKSSGSQMWSQVAKWLVANRPEITTVVSYSDPSVGHTGALYRACNWAWAPTWHRLRPPPTGNGAWTDGKTQSTKDRWVYPLRPDDDRAAILLVKDKSILRRMPRAVWKEPRFKRGLAVTGTAGVPYSLLAECGHNGNGGRSVRHADHDSAVTSTEVDNEV